MEMIPLAFFGAMAIYQFAQYRLKNNEKSKIDYKESYDNYKKKNSKQFEKLERSVNAQARLEKDQVHQNVTDQNIRKYSNEEKKIKAEKIKARFYQMETPEIKKIIQQKPSIASSIESRKLQFYDQEENQQQILTKKVKCELPNSPSFTQQLYCEEKFYLDQNNRMRDSVKVPVLSFKKETNLLFTEVLKKRIESSSNQSEFTLKQQEETQNQNLIALKDLNDDFVQNPLEDNLQSEQQFPQKMMENEQQQQNNTFQSISPLNTHLFPSGNNTIQHITPSLFGDHNQQNQAKETKGLINFAQTTEVSGLFTNLQNLQSNIFEHNSQPNKGISIFAQQGQQNSLFINHQS